MVVFFIIMNICKLYICVCAGYRGTYLYIPALGDRDRVQIHPWLPASLQLA